jgi:hypothetical protein
VELEQLAVVRTETRKRPDVGSRGSIGVDGVEEIKMHFGGTVFKDADMKGRKRSVVFNPALLPGFVIPSGQVRRQPILKAAPGVDAIGVRFGIENIIEMMPFSRSRPEEEAPVPRPTYEGTDQLEPALMAYLIYQ